jgi:acyl-CoA hydrolase
MSREMSLSELDLAEIIQPGDQIVWGQGAGEPSSLVETLLEQRHRIGHASVFLGGVRSRRTLKPEHSDVLAFSSIGAMGNLRGLAKAGLLHVVPVHLSQLNGYLDSGTIRSDVVFIHLSQPDASGEYSFSIANDFQQAAMRRARVVVAEVNDKLPWTYCDGRIDPQRIDILVHSSRAPVQVKPQPVAQEEEAIARHITSYIGDGTTIQIGIGAVPEAVMASIADRRDLGIHSGLISDRVADLIERGIITNARKPIDTGVTTTASLLGTDRLYRFAHKNPLIRLFTYSHTHRAEILSQLGRIVAINSAVEVDLTGQVNAEIVSGTYVGGVGGQGDFVRGVQMASHGRSIIALPSTAQNGAVSRIVTQLADEVITTVRSDADIIVTEFGAAELRGQPLDGRIRRMIAIAHPRFRESLERESRQLFKSG